MVTRSIVASDLRRMLAHSHHIPETDSAMRDISATLTRLVDSATGVMSALWPRSVAARELSRLAQEGHAVGELHDVLFAVSLDEEETRGAAIDVLQASGFALRGYAAGHCCTVAARIPLTAWQLHVATARLLRTLAPYGGFAAVIGPTGGPVPAATTFHAGVTVTRPSTRTS